MTSNDQTHAQAEMPARHYVNVKEPIMSGAVAEHGMTVWVDEERDVLCVGVYQTGDYICFGGTMPLVFAQMIASYGEQRPKRAESALTPEHGGDGGRDGEEGRRG